MATIRLEGVGLRAWWLAQLLARVPLARWTTRFGPCGGGRQDGGEGPPPAAIAAAFAATEWGVMALEGLARAALDAGEVGWIEALHAAVEPFATAKGRGDPLRFRAQSVFQELAPALPPARRAVRILAELRGDAPPAHVNYIADLPTPWPAELAEGVLAALARHLETAVHAKGYKPFQDPWIGVLHAAALGLPPEAEAALPALPPPRPDALTYLGNALDRLRQHLAIRRRLAEELAP